jgi:hypothetical protein
MSLREKWESDTFVSFVVRFILFAAFMAVSPFLIVACSKDGPSGGRLNATTSAEYQQYSSAGGTGDQTRNPLPQRGADEKSDSTPTKPPI